jgi:DNA modification methylase
LKHNWYFQTEYGRIFHGDSYHFVSNLKDRSIDLIVTSPPFGLVREKEYGNVPADDYLDWFRPYASQFHRVLKESGSLVIDIGGVWNKGTPTRHLYHFKLLIALCDEYGFHLAQDFYWWNPAKLPTPAEWVTVRRVRAKDAINKVWWLSKTEWPKASNRRVLQPYSSSMRELLQKGYKAKVRPSGHDISTRFSTDNGAAIPSNLLAIANTESNSSYLKYCKAHGLKPHPARFPAEIPEFFVRMLTDAGDAVIDPFAGSCVTGEVCERLKRDWTCVELQEEYLRGAVARFSTAERATASDSRNNAKRKVTYSVPRIGIMWGEGTDDKLPVDGGRNNTGKRKRDMGE